MSCHAAILRVLALAVYSGCWDGKLLKCSLYVGTEIGGYVYNDTMYNINDINRDVEKKNIGKVKINRINLKMYKKHALCP